MFILIIILGILFEICLIIFGINLLLKMLNKKEVLVKVDNKNIHSDIIKEGVKSAIREISEEDEERKKLELQIKNTLNHGQKIYVPNNKETPVKCSGGDLVPYGLSDSEKELIEMFYTKQD